MRTRSRILPTSGAENLRRRTSQWRRDPIRESPTEGCRSTNFQKHSKNACILPRAVENWKPMERGTLDITRDEDEVGFDSRLALSLDVAAHLP